MLDPTIANQRTIKRRLARQSKCRTNASSSRPSVPSQPTFPSPTILNFSERLAVKKTTVFQNAKSLTKAEHNTCKFSQAEISPEILPENGHDNEPIFTHLRPIPSPSPQHPPSLSSPVKFTPGSFLKNSDSLAGELRTEHIPNKRLTTNKAGAKLGEHKGEHAANTASGVHPHRPIAKCIALVPEKRFTMVRSRNGWHEQAASCLPVRKPASVACLRYALILASACLLLLQPLRADEPKTLDPIIVVPDTPVVEISTTTTLAEEIPPLRSFRAPILQNARKPWPFALLANTSDWVRETASPVPLHLEQKGIVFTLFHSMLKLPSYGKAINWDQTSPDSWMVSVGIPADLLRHFQVGFNLPKGTISEWLPIQAFAEVPISHQESVCSGFAQSAKYGFEATNPRFQIATESGENDIGLLRLQLTRGDDWLGHADGGAIDIARQLVTQLPEAEFLTSISKDHLTAFLATAKDWPAPAHDFTLIAENFPLAQWAQDNGKAGVLLDVSGRPVSAATLAPRYASRRDETSVFIPGESFAMDGLHTGGHPVFHSPLIFQGGNLMAVCDPKTQKRILLIGEAEILRNINLGLSREQVLEAFKVECAVDECRVIPSVSFHLDFDLTVRAVGDQLVAFVQDTNRGAKIVLAAGIDALAKSQYMEINQATAALSALQSNDPQKLLSALGPVLAKNVDLAGHFAESFAKAFSTSPVDSHVGNLRLFLVAMDTFVHRVVKTANPGTQAYLESYRRLEKDRAELHALLESWGWKVVPVPCLGEGQRAINPLNGIHDRRRYLMPAVGGLYSKMDDAAMALFQRECGPDVQIIPIRCAESQRRAGSLHCAVAAYPKIEFDKNEKPEGNN